MHPKTKQNKGFNTEKDRRSNNQTLQSPLLRLIKHQETFEDKKRLDDVDGDGDVCDNDDDMHGAVTGVDDAGPRLSPGEER